MERNMPQYPMTTTKHYDDRDGDDSDNTNDREVYDDINDDDDEN